jgi:hypothetical protein
MHSRQNHGACVRSAIVLCRDEQTRTRRCHPALAHGSALGKATTTRRAFSAVAPDMSQFGAGVALRPQRLQFEAGFNHQAASEKPLVRPGPILWWSRRGLEPAGIHRVLPGVARVARYVRFRSQMAGDAGVEMDYESQDPADADSCERSAFADGDVISLGSSEVTDSRTKSRARGDGRHR